MPTIDPCHSTRTVWGSRAALLPVLAVILLAALGCNPVVTKTGAQDVARGYIRENILGQGRDMEQEEWFPLQTNIDTLEMFKEASEGESQSEALSRRSFGPGEVLSVRVRFRPKGEKPAGPDPLAEFIDYSIDDGPADVVLQFPKTDSTFVLASNGERWQKYGGDKGWKPVEE